jgi:hypothetical protein
MSRSEVDPAESPRLRLGALPVLEPSPDLWPRIAAAQATVRRGTRRRRIGALLGCSAVLASAAWLALPIRHAASNIDWQARAQALELEVRALEARDDPSQRLVLSADARTELVRIDAALQAAYDTGAGAEDLGMLWKRRSELLSALLQARGQDFETSRI